MLKPFPTSTLVLALLAGFVFFAICLGLLTYGHPQEDAYILFKYVKNILAGEGIVFYPGGEPAEGATDFLWLIAVTALSATSLDIAISAALLNTVGLLLIATLVVLPLCRQQPWHYRLLATLLLLVLLASNTTYAAAAGFSVYFYCAPIVLMCYLMLVNTEHQLRWIPLLAILVGLIRPDGVIIGMVFTVLAFFRVLGSESLKPFLVNCLIALVIGISYFTWRYQYFGLSLPLPLYVKSDSDAMFAGASENLRWLYRHKVFLLFSFLVLAYGFWRGHRRELLALLPTLLLFAIMMFAHQSQNIGYRFQAPLYLSLFMVTSFILARLQVNKAFLALMVLVLVQQFAYYGDRTHDKTVKLMQPSYINVLAVELRKTLGDDIRVALTEAGRMPYWLDSPVLDFIGLNSPALAVNPVTPEDLQSFSPDLVFFHADMALEPFDSEKNIIAVTAMELQQHLREPVGNWQNTERRERRAALAASQFLISNKESFKIFAVRYSGGHQHIYGVQNHLAGKLQTALQNSWDIKNSSLSYFELKARDIQ